MSTNSSLLGIIRFNIKSIKDEKIFLRLILLLVLLIHPCYFYAQNKKIDSLKQELKIYVKQDHIKVDLLNQLATNLYEFDVDSGLILVEKSIKIAKKIEYEKGYADAIYLSGSIQINKANISQARSHFQLALKIYRQLNQQKHVAECLNGIGKTYYYESNYEKSLYYFEQSLSASEEINEINLVSAALSNIATVYSDQGKFEEAITKYKRTLEIERKFNNENGIAGSLINIGAIYFEESNFPLALKYYSDALQIYQQLDNKFGVANSYNNLGNIYSSQENWEKALECFLLTLDLYKELKNEHVISITQGNIGSIYSKLGDSLKADEYIGKAFDASKKLGNQSQITLCLVLKAEIKYKRKDYSSAYKNYEHARKIAKKINNKPYLCSANLGMANCLIEKKQFAQALKYANEAQKLSSELGSIIKQRDSYNLLSEIYQRTNEYEKSIRSHRIFKKLSDSVLNKENIKKIAQLEYEYKFRKELESAKKLELKLTNEVLVSEKNLQKSQKQKLGIILVSILISGIVIFLFWIKNLRSKSDNLLIEQRLLRLQMNPHFTFNALSAIQSMIKKDPEKAKQYLLRFSRLMAYLFESSLTNYVLLEDELESLKQYLELQQLLFNENFSYSIELDAIDPQIRYIPGMILQPIIENVIVHGFSGIDYHGKISLKMKQVGSVISCEIEDNGKGMSSINNKSGSSSTILISKFLTKISNCNFTIINKADKSNIDHGVIIKLTIPYN